MSSRPMPGPITTGHAIVAGWSRVSLQNMVTGMMGPGIRRGDTWLNEALRIYLNAGSTKIATLTAIAAANAAERSGGLLKI